MTSKWSVFKDGNAVEINVENGKNYLICTLFKPKIGVRYDALSIYDNKGTSISLFGENKVSMISSNVYTINNVAIEVTQDVFDDISEYLDDGEIVDHKFSSSNATTSANVANNANAANTDPINYPGNVNSDPQPFIGGMHRLLRKQRMLTKRRKTTRRRKSTKRV